MPGVSSKLLPLAVTGLLRARVMVAWTLYACVKATPDFRIECCTRDTCASRELIQRFRAASLHCPDSHRLPAGIVCVS
jgi:hypothetical protein